MKTLKTISIIAIILFLFAACFAQSPQVQTRADDLPTVQKALINSMLYAGELEKENLSIKNYINSLRAALGNDLTKNQLDSIRTVYQIPKAEKGKNDGSKGNKAQGE